MKVKQINKIRVFVFYKNKGVERNTYQFGKKGGL